MMNKQYKLIGLVFTLIFTIGMIGAPNQNIVQVKGVIQDKPVILVDAWHSFINSSESSSESMEEFYMTAAKWGYEVRILKENYTSGILSDVDILVMPRLSVNMSAASKAAIEAWFDGGNKGLWIAGDSDYNGYAQASIMNDLLIDLDSNIYFEQTSIEDPVENVGGSGYRVKATNFNREEDNAKYLTSGLPYDDALFHGPCDIIGMNSTGDIVPLEDASGTGYHEDFDIDTVEWVVRASKDAINVPATTNPTWQAHSYNEVNNFTMMALQTFAGDSKLVLTGEGIFSMYKNMFHDPAEYDVPHSDVYIVYNTLNWFNGILTPTTLPVMLVDAWHSFINSSESSSASMEGFYETAMSWGYEVRILKENYTSGILSDVDVLVIPRLSVNMSAASKAAIEAWFDSGNKGLWIAGDSDYNGYAQASIMNDLLIDLDSNIYFEQTSIEDPVENVGGSGYRVKATNFNKKEDNAKFLTSGLPYDDALFHGPCDIIGMNSTGDIVPLEDDTGAGYNEDFDIDTVEWVVRASKDAINVPATTNPTWQAHSYNEVNNFTMMALQTFAGDSKLVLTGEGIFSMYKNMFNDPAEYDVPHSDKYIVFNTLRWFTEDLKTENARTVILVDAWHSFINSSASSSASMEEFYRAAAQWGYEVRILEENYTSGILSDIDILVMPRLSANMSVASKAAIEAWFDSGNKGLWIAGDSDYNGYAQASIMNDLLIDLDSNIYFEQTSIEDPVENVGGSGYRVKATNFNREEDNAKYLTSGIPYDDALFHGPCDIIGMNSTGDIVPLEDASGTGYHEDFDIDTVEWVVRASKDAINVPATTNPTWQAHSYNEVNNFTMMALQTFAGDSKIVLTGENIFSMYKNMFNDPAEYDVPHSDKYIVWNTLNWMGPIKLRPFFTEGLRFTAPTEELSSTSTVELEWTNGLYNNEILSYEILVDGASEAIIGDTRYELDLEDGVYEVQVCAITIQYFKTYSDLIDVTIDTTAPELSIIGPANNSNAIAELINISWTATDAISGLDTVDVYIDGEMVETTTDTYYEVTGLADGEHSFHLSAVDIAGNVNISEMYYVTVDTTDPTISITAPTSSSSFTVGDNVAVTWTGTDASDLSYTVYVDGTEVTTTTGTSYTVTGLTAGSHTIKVKAEDTFGNYANAEVSITISAVVTTTTTTTTTVPAQSPGFNWIMIVGIGIGIAILRKRREQ